MSMQYIISKSLDYALAPDLRAGGEHEVHTCSHGLTAMRDMSTADPEPMSVQAFLQRRESTPMGSLDVWLSSSIELFNRPRPRDSWPCPACPPQPRVSSSAQLRRDGAAIPYGRRPTVTHPYFACGAYVTVRRTDAGGMRSTSSSSTSSAGNSSSSLSSQSSNSNSCRNRIGVLSCARVRRGSDAGDACGTAALAVRSSTSDSASTGNGDSFQGGAQLRLALGSGPYPALRSAQSRTSLLSVQLRNCASSGSITGGGGVAACGPGSGGGFHSPPLSTPAPDMSSLSLGNTAHNQLLTDSAGGDGGSSSSGSPVSPWRHAGSWWCQPPQREYGAGAADRSDPEWKGLDPGPGARPYPDVADDVPSIKLVVDTVVGQGDDCLPAAATVASAAAAFWREEAHWQAGAAAARRRRGTSSGYLSGDGCGGAGDGGSGGRAGDEVVVRGVGAGGGRGDCGGECGDEADEGFCHTLDGELLPLATRPCPPRPAFKHSALCPPTHPIFLLGPRPRRASPPQSRPEDPATSAAHVCDVPSTDPWVTAMWDTRTTESAATNPRVTAPLP